MEKRKSSIFCCLPHSQTKGRCYVSPWSSQDRSCAPGWHQVSPKSLSLSLAPLFSNLRTLAVQTKLTENKVSQCCLQLLGFQGASQAPFALYFHLQGPLRAVPSCSQAIVKTLPITTRKVRDLGQLRRFNSEVNCWGWMALWNKHPPTASPQQKGGCFAGWSSGLAALPSKPEVCGSGRCCGETYHPPLPLPPSSYFLRHLVLRTSEGNKAGYTG